MNAFVNAGFGQDKLVTAGSDAAQSSGDSGALADWFVSQVAMGSSKGLLVARAP